MAVGLLETRVETAVGIGISIFAIAIGMTGVGNMTVSATGIGTGTTPETSGHDVPQLGDRDRLYESLETEKEMAPQELMRIGRAAVLAMVAHPQ